MDPPGFSAIPFALPSTSPSSTTAARAKHCPTLRPQSRIPSRLWPWRHQARSRLFTTPFARSSPFPSQAARFERAAQSRTRRMFEMDEDIAEEVRVVTPSRLGAAERPLTKKSCRT